MRNSVTTAKLPTPTQTDLIAAHSKKHLTTYGCKTKIRQKCQIVNIGVKETQYIYHDIIKLHTVSQISPQLTMDAFHVLFCQQVGIGFVQIQHLQTLLSSIQHLTFCMTKCLSSAVAF